MRTITVHVSEPVYKAYQDYAREHDRKTAELVREAMAVYLETKLRRSTSLRDLKPLDLGRVKRPLRAGEDLMAEMRGLDRG